MHIPDGYLTPYVFVPAFVITIIWWAICIKKVKLTEKQVPILGLLMCAFLCRHDDELACRRWNHRSPARRRLYGPNSWTLCRRNRHNRNTSSCKRCCFGDGGLTTLGANVLNMGIIAVLVPCAIFLLLYKFVGVKGNKLYAVIFVSAFAGDVLAAIAAGTELGLSQPVFQYGLNVAVPAMAINHSIIGVGEGIITCNSGRNTS